MTPITEHKCELLLKSGLEIVKFYDSGWCLDVDEYRFFDINYCQYCGAKLE